MQYTPLAIATVATEAAQRYIDTTQPQDRELVARVWADLTHEMVFDSITGLIEETQDARSWDLVIFDVMEEFLDWLEQHALAGAPVERIGRFVLNSCSTFVNLER